MDVAFDPCDACGVRSYVWVLIGTHELSYCAHHGTKYMPRLLEVGKVHDLRYLITA